MQQSAGGGGDDGGAGGDGVFCMGHNYGDTVEALL